MLKNSKGSINLLERPNAISSIYKIDSCGITNVSVFSSNFLEVICLTVHMNLSHTQLPFVICLADDYAGSCLQVCKHAFAFSPVYAEDAPVRLPFREFVLGIGKKTCHVLKFFLRLGFVLSVWLLIIPFITFWIWRLAFVRSFSEANRLFLSHMSFTVILTDCLHGFLLSASIVFIFLGATSLRDYFRHVREAQGHDLDREDEGDRNGARAVRRPLGQANRNLLADGNVDDVGEAQGIAAAGQLIRRAENVAAQWERQAARLEVHVDQIFDGLDDADGAEDVPFDELVGMQGPVFHLVENAFTVSIYLSFAETSFFIPISHLIPPPNYH